jgi:hypothetical protein
MGFLQEKRKNILFLKKKKQKDFCLFVGPPMRREQAGAAGLVHDTDPAGPWKRMSKLPPFAPAGETWARAVVLSKNCSKCAVWLPSASNWKKASNTPDRLSRQNRFHMLFQLPNSLGRARQLML